MNLFSVYSAKKKKKTKKKQQQQKKKKGNSPGPTNYSLPIIMKQIFLPKLRP